MVSGGFKMFHGRSRCVPICLRSVPGDAKEFNGRSRGISRSFRGIQGVSKEFRSGPGHCMGVTGDFRGVQVCLFHGSFKGVLVRVLGALQKFSGCFGEFNNFKGVSRIFSGVPEVLGRLQKFSMGFRAFQGCSWGSQESLEGSMTFQHLSTPLTPASSFHSTWWRSSQSTFSKRANRRSLWHIALAHFLCCNFSGHGCRGNSTTPPLHHRFKKWKIHYYYIVDASIDAYHYREKATEGVLRCDFLRRNLFQLKPI